MQFTVPYLQFCTFTFAHAFLGISCAQTVFSLVLVLVLAVPPTRPTAGYVPLSTLVVGAEASYASTPRGGRLSGQAAKLGRWWRARKNGDWFRTLQSRKSQYCSQYTCINVLQRVEIYCPEYARTCRRTNRRLCAAAARRRAKRTHRHAAGPCQTVEAGRLLIHPRRAQGSGAPLRKT